MVTSCRANSTAPHMSYAFAAGQLNCEHESDSEWAMGSDLTMSRISDTYGILDGGATSTCGSYDLIQTISDEWEAFGQETTVETCSKEFMFGGGEVAESKVKAWLPHDVFADGLGVSTVPTTATPVLIGTDMLRYYGLVLDYHNDTVFSHRLQCMLPAERLPSGHLAVQLLPPQSPKAIASKAMTDAAARRRAAAATTASAAAATTEEDY